MKNNDNIKLKKKCIVSEIIISCKISFQVFCEVCQKNIELVNSGYIPFTFATSSLKEAEMESSEHLLEVGWLTVQPRKGVLQPNCSIELNIKYFPGIAGKFSECFNIEVFFVNN